MPAKLTALTRRPAWQALAAHYKQARAWHLRDLFAKDPKRGERLTAEAVGLYLDYSKHRITDETLALLLQLAEECALHERIAAMFRGEKLNVTEHRAACTWRFAPRERPPSWWTVRTWCLTCTPCSTGCDRPGDESGRRPATGRTHTVEELGKALHGWGCYRW